MKDHAASFAQLAAELQVSRSHLHEIRLRDSRFPGPGPDGRWPVVAVGLLLLVRDLERTSDYVFTVERVVDGLPPRPGARQEL